MQHIETPSTIEDAYNLLLQNDKNVVIGGGAWLRLGNKEIDTVVSLDLLGLDTITETKDTIVIGSMTTLRDIETSSILQNQMSGILTESVKQIMGVQIRNIATIGGSIAGKYSFSDILPVLLVMNTTLRFHKQGDITLSDFIKQKKMDPDILVSILIQKESGKAYFQKVAKTILSFALLNIAISNCTEYKIQIGARPGSVKPATKACAYLNSCTTVTDVEIKNAVELALDELSVSSNSKASKEYREDLLRVYLTRGLKEVM